MSGVYINLLTDFGFKRVFGTEENKHLLIDFINQLITEHTIVDLTYLPTEHKGTLPEERDAIFDLHCKTEDNEYVLIEVQRGYQAHFKDRSVYYSACSIQQHARKGKWNYQLPKVYTICLLEFCFQPKEKQQLITHIQLCDIETGGVFYDKLQFIYVQLPLFTKSIDSVDNRLEKWLFLLQRLPTLAKKDVGNNFVEPLFSEVVHLAEVANMSKEQKLMYDVSWKRYNDYHNTMDYAKQSGLEKGLEKGIEIGRKQGIERGREQGREQEKIQTAKRLKELNVPIQTIVEVTKLSIQDIEKL